VRRFSVIFAVRLALFLAASVGVAAQIVPVSQEPFHRVVFEDASLRVLDVNIPSGTTTLDHRHDHDLLIVSVGASDTRTRTPGSDWGPVRPRRVLGETSVTDYVGQPGVHAIQNVGADAYRLIAVENARERGWSALPPVAPAGAEVLADGRAFRATRVRVTGGETAVAGVHALPSVLILVSGDAVISRGGHAVALSPTARWTVVGAGEPFTVASKGVGESQLVAVEVR
jgi:mannose-6-phosphate isomerase-like protein (cupin superfamily)